LRVLLFSSVFMKKLLLILVLNLLLIFSVFPQTIEINNHKDYLRQSSQLINQRKRPEAIKLITEAIEKFPNESTLYFRRAKFYRHDKKYDLMEIDTKAAIGVATDKYNAYVYGGVLLMGARKCQKAFELLTIAINLDASKHTAFFNRASVHHCLGDKVKALNDINYALTIDPDNNLAKSFRNNLLTEIGRNQPTSETNSELINSLEKKLQHSPPNSRL